MADNIIGAMASQANNLKEVHVGLNKYFYGGLGFLVGGPKGQELGSKIGGGLSMGIDNMLLGAIGLLGKESKTGEVDGVIGKSLKSIEGMPKNAADSDPLKLASHQLGSKLGEFCGTEGKVC